MKTPYQPQSFEKKWQEVWDKEKIYSTNHQSPITSHSKKQYILAMFPYPSGAGLHVGHVRNYTGTDVLARYFRMNGYSVLHPMGWDAFGLPAENAAVKAKKNPMDMVPEHINTFRRQMKSLGFSYDWEREFSTTDPEYYKWTQWLFIQFFKMGLLYKKNAPINYCPKCKTGLAEEEVLADGTHERCGNIITKKDLPQWIFAITKYADRLLSDLEGLDWPEGILAMQRNWIGRKEGINIDYKVIDEEARHRVFSSTSPPTVVGGSPKSLTQKQVSSLPIIDTITCFTTRPDTNFGATFIVIAPEHPLVEKILNPKSEIRKKSKFSNSKIEEIRIYVESAKSKTEMEREAEGRKKTGVFTGFYAINNLNGRLMPVYISDFVLMGFGTGAVVGVPGHDVRDYQFAQEFGLPVEVVVLPNKNSEFRIQNSELQFKIQNEWKEGAYEGEGVIINSDFLSGMKTKEAIGKIMDYLEEKGWGKRKVSYHLRDWIFSRQRYWGEPIPMVFCSNCAKNQSQISNLKSQISNEMFGWFPVPEDQLPLKLPYVSSYEPIETGESPLSVVKDWVNTKCPNCGGPAKRETDTMPNWAGSCWYFLAFAFWNQKKEKSQITNHKSQINSKFQISNSKNLEPGNSDLFGTWNLEFGALMKNWLPVDWYLGGAEHAVLHLLYSRFWVKALYDLGLLDFKEPFLRLRNQGMILAEDHRKMSKSFGNVINPDDVVSEYGADALRIYEMFMAPFNTEIPWSTKALQGSYRFVKRVWELYQKLKIENEKLKIEENKELVAKLNKTIKKVTDDIAQIKFNTAIAAMMEFVNAFEKSVQVKSSKLKVQSLSKENAKKFLQILAPFAPFMTEEIWREVFGEKTSIHLSIWPEAEEVEDEEVVIPVQVNGKLRATIKVRSYELGDRSYVEKKALENEKVKKYLEGKNYKMIYVKGKVVNFVVVN